jgi:hypothetical protein
MTEGGKRRKEWFNTICRFDSGDRTCRSLIPLVENNFCQRSQESIVYFFTGSPIIDKNGSRFEN